MDEPQKEQHDRHMATQGNVCRCGHHKVIPVLVILLGIDFLLGAVGIFTGAFVDVTWPILAIIGGCMMLQRCGCCTRG